MSNDSLHTARCYEVVNKIDEVRKEGRDVPAELVLEFLDSLSEGLDQLGEEIDELFSR